MQAGKYALWRSATLCISPHFSAFHHLYINESLRALLFRWLIASDSELHWQRCLHQRGLFSIHRRPTILLLQHHSNLYDTLENSAELLAQMSMIYGEDCLKKCPLWQ